MSWQIFFHEAFEAEFQCLSEKVQDELLAHATKIEVFGPTLGRPSVDTLKASQHKNMKELRFQVENSVWRVAFAFDPRRHAILLVAGDKQGKNQKRFYTGSCSIILQKKRRYIFKPCRVTEISVEVLAAGVFLVEVLGDALF